MEETGAWWVLHTLVDPLIEAVRAPLVVALGGVGLGALIIVAKQHLRRGRSHNVETGVACVGMVLALLAIRAMVVAPFTSYALVLGLAAVVLLPVALRNTRLGAAPSGVPGRRPSRTARPAPAAAPETIELPDDLRSKPGAGCCWVAHRRGAETLAGARASSYRPYCTRHKGGDIRGPRGSRYWMCRDRKEEGKGWPTIDHALFARWVDAHLSHLRETREAGEAIEAGGRFTDRTFNQAIGVAGLIVSIVAIFVS